MRITNILCLYSILGPVFSQITGNVNASSIIYQLSSDVEFAYQLEQSLSLADAGGVSPGEVLRAASQITPGDFESYYRAFYYLAAKVHNIAESVNATRFPASAREAFFRASRYFTSADFFLHGNWSDPRIMSLYASALTSFDRATALLDIPAQRINISATDTIKKLNFTVPIIFYKASTCNEKRPTLVVCNGYDGPQEDLYFAMGTRALERGWNFVSYEGPGQPTVRRYQDLGFIPNWWDVVTPIVDYLETRDDVDTKKMALEGVSFGGILAPRAASREKRFAAVLAIDGLYNVQTSLRSQFPPALFDIFDAGNRSEFDTFMAAAEVNTSYPSSFRWAVDQGKWSFNTESAYDWLTQIGQVNLTQGLLDQVQGPVFVGEGQDDTDFYGQGKVVANWLGDRGYYHLFTNDIGAGQHGQVGAEAELAHVSFDWLGGIFDGLAKTKNGTYRL